LPIRRGRGLDTLEGYAGQLSKPLSYPLAAAAFLKDHLAKTSLRKGDVEVKACSNFDDRFDIFWEDLKKRIGTYSWPSARAKSWTGTLNMHCWATSSGSSPLLMVPDWSPMRFSKKCSIEGLALSK